MSTRDRAVGARLALQLNDILLDIRKSFGMHGRTSWNVDHVDPDVIALRFFHWKTHVPVIYTATNVRNAMLNLLHDTVPCVSFHAVFRRPDRSRAYRRVDLDFYPPGTPDLPSQLIVIEENVEPHRQHWRTLLDCAAGSATYFTRARRGRNSMTREERWAFFDLLENTQEYKDRWTEQGRLDAPQMTEEQLESSWRQMADQFGLPPTRPAKRPAKA